MLHILTERIVLTCMLNMQVQLLLQAVVGRGDAIGENRYNPKGIVYTYIDMLSSYVLWNSMDYKYLMSSTVVM